MKSLDLKLIIGKGFKNPALNLRPIKSFMILFALFLITLTACNNRVDETIPKDYSHFENWDEWWLSTDDGINLFVKDFGEGDTVIVLHGGWGHQHNYLIDAFTNIADKYHFVLYDQRGSLRSHCPDSLISVAKHIEDLEQLRKELGPEKVVLVGHSMGGLLAMYYLEKYPENVKGLILLSTLPAKYSIYEEYAMTENQEESALARWKRQEVLDTLAAHGLDAKWSSEERKNLTSKQRGTWHRITQSAINMHSVKNWRKFRGAFYYKESAAMAAATTMTAWDVTEIMKELNIPITIIHGDDDFSPVSLHKGWTSEIPNVELKVIENAGHNPWICQPEIFKNYILEALEKYRK